MKKQVLALFLSIFFTIGCLGAAEVKKPAKPSPVPEVNMDIDQFMGLSLTSWCNLCFKNLREYTRSEYSSFIDIPTLLSKDTFLALLKHFQTSTINSDTKYGMTKNTNWVKPPDDGVEVKTILSFPYAQRVILKPGETAVITGDLHSSLHSTLRNLLRMLSEKLIKDNFKLAKGYFMFFLGDISDRGRYGAESWATIIRLKIANPDRVFIMKGNHEDTSVNKVWGFQKELFDKYQIGTDELENVYKILPEVTFLGCQNSFVQLCHGGIELGYNPQDLLLFSNESSQISYQALTMADPSRGIYGNIDRTRVISELPEPWHGEVLSLGLNIDLPVFGFNTSDFFTKLKIGRGDVLAATQPFTKILFEKITRETPGATLHSIFRGHQHSDSATTEESFSGFNVFDESGLHPGLLEPGRAPGIAFPIGSQTIYTLFSAPEALGANYDCFVTIKTGPTYADWQLRIFEYYLDEDRKNLLVMEYPRNMIDIGSYLQTNKDGSFSWRKTSELTISQIRELVSNLTASMSIFPERLEESLPKLIFNIHNFAQQSIHPHLRKDQVEYIAKQLKLMLFTFNSQLNKPTVKEKLTAEIKTQLKDWANGLIAISKKSDSFSKSDITSRLKLIFPPEHTKKAAETKAAQPTLIKGTKASPPPPPLLPGIKKASPPPPPPLPIKVAVQKMKYKTQNSKGILKKGAEYVVDFIKKLNEKFFK
ncbi:hypothetical protein HN446_05250 [bacterium]|jgi:hypothetical protein|nr:hypothetical protein [bacterium]